ncbi:MAG TPA: hypothetical protein VL549_13495 [Gemmatimonadales bacterium]|jgi:hypothetical protein|nr:hypothetical protein [Gemmatimonadales bacterium]
MDDTTLGGYEEVHGRPPAFGGPDGRPYSVGTFADDTSVDGRYGAALLFVCWGEGERPVGHLETDYLAFGTTPEEALAPVLALTLEQVKALLDQCVARSRERA